ncbi:hypothetical protein Ahy_B10g102608 [Arachis hypogaea]|uniref:Uncharacterized protein n=1 Tax=Arachis hypogaea TaxID=3818 RepID=A0A444X2A2_ARAHY|nr:hypothetical protein Ahy_B10g102608 [Arachis hypogaea]
MKKCSFFNLETATRELRITLKISQTSLVFSAKTTTGEESREYFERKKKKQTKTRIEIVKLMNDVQFSGVAKIKKTMVTKKEKPRYKKTHDLKCQTKAIAKVFKVMSQEKRDIVEEMGFGALAHDPGNERDRFPEKVDYDRLNEADKQIIDGFKCVTLASLTKFVLDMSVDGEENRQKFWRTFVVFVQKCFLLPTMVSMASLIHKPPALHVDNIRQWDWANHVMSFLRKGIRNMRKGKKIGKEKGKRKTEEKKIIFLDSSSKEDSFSDSESKSESKKTLLAKRTRQQRLIRKQQVKLKAVPRIQKAEVNPKSVSLIEEEEIEKTVKRKENNHRREKEIEKTPTMKRKQPERGAKKQTKSRKLVLTDSKSKTESERESERVRVSVAERRREALQLLKEKRAKRRNDGAQTTNVAPDRFELTEAQNDLSERLPTVNLGNEPLLQTQTSSTLSVNAPANTRKNTPETPQPLRTTIAAMRRSIGKAIGTRSTCRCLPSGIRKIGLRGIFPDEDGARTSIECNNNYGFNLPEEQQQPCQEPPVARQLEEEAHADFCPPEPEKQAGEESSPRKMKQKPTLNV